MVVTGDLEWFLYWLIMIHMQWLKIVNNGEWMYDYGGGSMVVNGGEIGI